MGSTKTRASRRAPDPIAPSALRTATFAVGLVLVAAVVGAAVRILPWILDPQIAWSTLAPFAKSLLAVAVEAAILTGWPVGWSLAAARLVERGEARVIASLGESPARTVLRLAPQGVIFAALLASTSLALGREAAAPGRVVDALLAEGRAACTRETGHSTRGVPFVSATWLCDSTQARLVGRAPIGGVVFTASDAHVSDDLRRIELADARLALSSSPQAMTVHVHVGTLVLRGLAPWAQASALPPWLRAIVVTASGLAAAAAAVFAVLRSRRRVGGVLAVVVGASGALASLATLRGLELRVPEVGAGGLDALGSRWLLSFAIVPLAAVVAVAAVIGAVTLLPDARRTGSK